VRTTGLGAVVDAGRLPIVPRGEDRQEVANALLADEAVAQWLISVDRVVVAAAGSRARDVARRRQVVDDPVSGSFGDADTIAKLAKTHARILSDAQQDARVVGQKRPRRYLRAWHLAAEY
jgi:hypothetical protein